ncbi:Arc family DNA-binding protein [uncultured Oscillibacter sp.]|jgi:predicted DNA-binding protein|uniref:Arc family DNA-binding protein n=1 Tax=uncultured Oscillibacter sp. TaxID=876091 RepID=UPI002170434F|nr:Arc family DNA-binding protein [uncultured Oscillibacter sp.]MCI9553660.1 Arc family DNA-binding protein [Oscillibacter sp.]
MPNAPRKKLQYGLRISSEIMDKLKYIADRSGRSANKEIEQLIIQHIETWEKAHGPILFDDGFVPRSRS